jgi:hypothetical protein
MPWYKLLKEMSIAVQLERLTDEPFVEGPTQLALASDERLDSAHAWLLGFLWGTEKQGRLAEAIGYFR